MTLRADLPRGLLIVLLISPCIAGAADLLEVFRIAQSADSTYASARSQWAAAQERIPIGRAGLLPTVQITASAQREDRDIRFRTAPRTYSETSFNSSGVTLSVTQPLLRRQNSIVYDQALTQAEQADAQLAVSAQDVILRTSQAYFDVLLAQDSLALAQAQKASLGEQVKQARRNFEVGTAPVTDVHEAQARFDLISAQEIVARDELELRRRALEQIIGREPPPLAPLGPDFVLKLPEPATLDPWLSLAAQNNLQVKVARSAIMFSTQEIARNRAAHLPTLDVFANVSNNAAGAGIQGTVGNETANKVVGLQLAVPIYSGGASNARVREAIANEDRAKNEFETARRAAVFAARQAFLGITNGTALVRALETALVSTESQLKSTRVGQQVGVRTIVDVLNAQQLLFSARRDLAQAKYNYVVSLLRLEAAIGELTEQDIAAVNQWLDRTVSASPPVELPAGDATPAAPPLDPSPAAEPIDKPPAPKPATDVPAAERIEQPRAEESAAALSLPRPPRATSSDAEAEGTAPSDTQRPLDLQSSASTASDAPSSAEETSTAGAAIGDAASQPDSTAVGGEPITAPRAAVAVPEPDSAAESPIPLAEPPSAVTVVETVIDSATGREPAAAAVDATALPDHHPSTATSSDRQNARAAAEQPMMGAADMSTVDAQNVSQKPLSASAAPEDAVAELVQSSAPDTHTPKE